METDIKKRFTEEQIIGGLKEAQAGMKVCELCRKHGISEPTYYNWEAKYGGMTASEAKRLKRLLADAHLDIAALKDVVRRKW